MTHAFNTILRVSLPAALPLMLALCGGCAEQLTLDIVLATETASMTYHLDPDGRLAVTGGSGMVEGRSPDQLFQTTLDEPAMTRLKRTIHASRFLLEDAPDSEAEDFGPAMVVDIELGLWHNTVQLRGQYMPSLGKIVDQLNQQLPAKYRLKYAPGPPRPKTTEPDW